MNNLKPLNSEELRSTEGGIILAWVVYHAIKGAYEQGYDEAQKNCTCQQN